MTEPGNHRLVLDQDRLQSGVAGRIRVRDIVGGGIERALFRLECSGSDRQASEKTAHDLDSLPNRIAVSGRPARCRSPLNWPRPGKKSLPCAALGATEPHTNEPGCANRLPPPFVRRDCTLRPSEPVRGTVRFGVRFPIRIFQIEAEHGALGFRQRLTEFAKQRETQALRIERCWRVPSISFCARTYLIAIPVVDPGSVSSSVKPSGPFGEAAAGVVRHV